MSGIGQRMGLVALVMVVAAPVAGSDLFTHSVASGDPRANSVVLWTRVDNPPVPDALQVEVATDVDFNNVVITRQLEASADNDWCVKVRIDGLAPYTTYFYRFVYGTGAMMELSPVGRTKTAPTADMEVPIRFAVVYCQDYIGRYYNSYAKLLRDHDDDVDFVVHLGDYIYETTGDPSFQDPDSERKVVFQDEEGAIELGAGDSAYLAAASLSNYRDLYRTYHSDPMLQQVHERWPMIVMWDDHEYSNDSWGATATYYNGRVDEYDVVRKQNSERAFFEWVPIDGGLNEEGELDVEASDLYPNTKIYRDFLFGSLLHLVLPDLRTYRPDHLIPEDAFPGTIAVDEAALADMLGAEAWSQVRSSFDPYVDMDVLGAGLPILRNTLTLIASQLYQMENPALDLSSAMDLARTAMRGNVSTTFANALFDAAGYPPPFSPEVQAQLPRGISYLFLGKTAVYSSSGSRTQVMLDPFNLFAAYRYLTSGGAAQDVHGPQQNAWFQGTLLASPAVWKVVGNSFIMTPLVIDFTNPFIDAILPPGFPDELRTRLLINAEDFNGLPQKRQEILGLLELVDNAVVISGDIHATFVTNHQNGVFEFTPPAISSGTNGELVLRAILADPILGQIPGIEVLASNYGLLLQVSAHDDVMVSPSDIFYQNTWAHGFGIADVTADTFTFTIFEIPSDEVGTSYYDDPTALDDLFQSTSFVVEDGQLGLGR